MYKRSNHNPLKDTILIFIAIVFFVGAPVQLANWQIYKANHQVSPISMVKNIQLRDGEHAMRYLASYGFDMKKIRQKNSPVPEIYFANVPRELVRMKDVRMKKELFLSSLLPPILKVNETIRQDRKKLKKMILNITLGTDISEIDYYWLTRKLSQYRVQVKDVQDFVTRTGEIFEELLNRMNIIPPELALAQAAQESGWGTSRFAQQGNALYGQWTWGKGCGMVPQQRDEDKTHRMKCFKNIIEAVDSYMLNLNTHRAYKALRDKRRVFRDDQAINVFPLVETLVNYSEEGPEYVEKIKNIIRVNKLSDFKDARLENSSPDN
ncbi:MAG: glucosaminidase domain-containing protein [Emcibacter sp.]|nr:glucosaminidase domain-containing protein [Emcibacter sp.]